jgi:HD-GYP domain-containing protein (c-di-GMP phosphodiesterase class II)
MLMSADKLRIRIADLLIGRKEVAFYMVGGELFFEKISIPIDQSLALILEQCAARDVGGIVFKPGLAAEELIRFASVMNKDASFLAGQQDINAVIRKEDITHIEFHRVLLVDKEVAGAVKAGKQKASEIFRETLETVKEMAKAVQLDRASNARKMNSAVQTMVDNILDNRDAFLGLTNIKMHDEYTFAHSVNVSILSVSLGTFLSLEKRQIAALGLAGLMHDIGKLQVPQDIINKPGKLTEEEWETVKRHPVEGALLLAGTPGVSKLAMVAAFEHHQHAGMGGYPRIEGQTVQHPFSQIVKLADAYEAITAARVYYSMQTPPDEAVRILLKKRGAPFNPVLVNAFVKMIGIFPIGTVVKLDTGETGVVMHQTSDLLRPRVLILSTFDGSEKESGQTVSLLETSKGLYKRSISGTIDPNAARLDIKKYLD